MESVQNNPSQGPSSTPKSSFETKAPNFDSLNLSNESKQDNNNIITAEMSTDISRRSFFEMALLESPDNQPSSKVGKDETLLNQLCRKKAASCFPANSQTTSTDTHNDKRVLSPQPHTSFDTDSEICNSSFGNLCSQSSQENNDNLNESSTPGQKKSIHSELNKVLESEINKEIGLSSDLLSDLTLRKYQSEITVKTELPNLELGLMQTQSVRPFNGSYEEEKRPSPFNKSPRETSKLSLEKLKKVAFLGEGGFAKVYLMKDVTNSKLYALKKIEKNKLKRYGKEHQMFVEKEVLRRLNKTNRPNFTRYYGSREDDEYLYLILEYVNGGGFSEYLKMRKTISKDQIRQFSAEIIDILECIHSCGVIHRDLKPENLLLTDTGHIKCIDFGGAKIINDDTKISAPQLYPDSIEDADIDNRGARFSFGGTRFYVSPEVLDERECGHAVDLWALGCIIYQMATGNVPFADKSDFRIFEKIKNVEIQYPETMDSEIKDLIQRLLVKEPHLRLGAGPKGSDNSYAALKSHPFFKIFQKIDFKQISLKLPPENELILAHIREKKEKLEIEKRKPKEEKKSKLLNSNSVRLKNEDIILSGCVLKDCGWLIYRRRQLILDNERLQYHDPEKNILKGEIPLSKILQVEIDPKHKQTFIIHIETRKYTFKIEQDHTAETWVRTINDRLRQIS